MKRNRWMLAAVLAVCLGAFLSSSAFGALAPYDDFSSEFIDMSKWQWPEFVREVRDGQFISMARAPGSERAEIFALFDPRSSLEARMTLKKAEGGVGWIRSRLGGRFYNDGSRSDPFDQTGDTWAEISLGLFDGELKARWAISRSTDPEGMNWELIAHGDLAGVALNTPYIVKVYFNPEMQTFYFSLLDSPSTPLAEAQHSVDPMALDTPTSPGFGLGCRIGGRWGLVKSAFDDVVVNGRLYDDFESDQLQSPEWPKWATDLVREIRGGSCLLRVRTNSGQTNGMPMGFIPSDYREVSVLGTLKEVSSNDQANARLLLGGFFYSDSPDSEIYAEIGIGDMAGDGTDQLKAWVTAVRFTDFGLEILDIVELVGDIELDTPYNLFYRYDGENTLTFGVDGMETTIFGPARFGPPMTDYIAVGPRITAVSGSAVASVVCEIDDVFAEEREEAPERMDWYMAVSSSGGLGTGFAVRDEYRDMVQSATVTGPNGFFHRFDLDNPVIWPSECHPAHFWWMSYGPVFDYGTYDLTLWFDDGLFATLTKELGEADPVPVDVSTMSHTSNSDGSMEFAWSPPAPGQFYQVRIRGTDDNIEYYASPPLGDTGMLHVPGEDLRCLEEGQSYTWFIRSFGTDPVFVDGVFVPNAWEQSESLVFTAGAAEVPKGRYTLLARVFVDFRCDTFYKAGVDRPLADVPVTMTFANGAELTQSTQREGYAYFYGFDPTEGVTVEAELPEAYRGYGIEICRTCYETYELDSGDFSSFRYRYVQFRATLFRK